MERLFLLCNPFAPNMERLFSPCNRLYDSLESEKRREIMCKHNDRLWELNLDVSTEILLSAERGFRYADLYAMLRKRKLIAWLTPHVAVVSGYGRAHLRNFHLQYLFSFRIIVNGKKIHALTDSSAAFSEMFDVVRRLLLADVREVYELDLKYENSYYRHWTFFNAATLADLMEQCQSLKALKLENVALDENHVRVLGDISKPGLGIELRHCRITGAATVLAEVLASNQGPTKLHRCYMDYSVFANGLRGNSRLKSLTLKITHNVAADGNQEVLAIAGALKENKGLVELDFTDGFPVMSAKTWNAVCDSLKTHPTLEVLDVGLKFWFLDLAPRVLKTRIQALVDMLKVNMSIHTIPLVDYCSEHELFRGSVIPYLEMNRLRPRVRAIQKARPVSYRAKVLGRALIATRTDVNSLWMLLSGNAEVAFPSTAATTAPAFSRTGAWCLCCW
jgi:hypothetical protein